VIVFSYQYFQFNEEIRHNSHVVLQAMTQLKADFIVLGADQSDVFNGLAHNFQDPCWGFRGKAATRMAQQEWRQKFGSPLVKHSLQQQLQQPPQRHGSGESTSAVGLTTRTALTNTSSLEEGGLDLPDEQAVLFLSRGGDDDDDDNDDGQYLQDDFEEGSQRQQQQPQQHSIVSNKPQPLTEWLAVGEQQVRQQQQQSGPSYDCDVDSFIVEDTEEGESSLRASPQHLSRPSNPSFAMSDTNSSYGVGYVDDADRAGNGIREGEGDVAMEEDPTAAMAHLQQYLQYAKYPAVVSELLMHEAVAAMNRNSNVMSSFILAHIPIKTQKK
jgi:hypothetical protein